MPLNPPPRLVVARPLLVLRLPFPTKPLLLLLLLFRMSDPPLLSASQLRALTRGPLGDLLRSASEMRTGCLFVLLLWW